MGRRLAVIAALALIGCGVLVGSSDDGATTAPPTPSNAPSDAAVPPDAPSPVDAGDAGDASDGGGCGDTSSDPLNCGSCGHVCNLDAGCSSGSCDRRFVFVSSTTYQGGAFMGTLADGTCTALAQGAGLTGSFRAWLTHASQPNRFATVVPHPYYTTTGDIVSNAWPPGTSLASPIDTDEHRNGVGQAYAWTNLTGSGTLAAVNDCLGWGSNNANQQGAFGRTDRTDQEWSQGTDPNNNNSAVFPCNESLHLYCVEYP